MKTLTLTAAAFALTAGTALAQTTPAAEPIVAPADSTAAATAAAPAMQMGTSAVADGIFRAEDIEDRDIYTLSRDGSIRWTDDTVYADIDPTWENIGEIEDVLLNSQGQMVGLTADVGGWLGLGAKEVMIPLSDLRPVVRDGDIVYVTQMSEEQLKSLPEVTDDYWKR